MTITHLIERLEAAEKGSERFDVEILCAVLAPPGSYIEQSKLNGRWCIYEQPKHAKSPRIWQPPRAYRDEHAGPTQSLDAITALIEEKLPGCKRVITKYPKGWAHCTLFLANNDTFGTRICKTEALACCAAFLRAYQAQEHADG